MSRRSIAPVLSSLLAAALAWPGYLAIRARGEDAPPPAAEAPKKAKIRFTPEIEGKFRKLLDWAEVAVRKLLQRRLAGETGEIAAACPLSEAEQRGLAELAERTVDATAKQWTACFDDVFRRVLQEDPWQLDLALATSEHIDEGQIDTPPGGSQPYDHPVWTEGLERVLTPEHLAAWKPVLAARKAALDGSSREALKAGAARVKEKNLPGLLARSAAIADFLRSTPEQKRQLDDLARKIAGAKGEAWMETGRKMWAALPPEQRNRVESMLAIMPPGGEGIAEAMWQAGLPAIVAPEGARRWQAEAEANSEECVKALAELLITQVDETACFTVAQRASLQPLAETAVRAQPALLSAWEVQIQPYASLLYGAASTLPIKRLQPLLEPGQLAAWREVCGLEQAREIPPNDEALARAEAAARVAPPWEFEEAREGVISTLVWKHVQSFQTDLRAAYRRAIDDAARASACSAAQLHHLALAAKVAAEADIQVFAASTENDIRSALNGANPKELAPQLKQVRSLGRPIRGMEQTPAGLQAWSETVKKALSDEQRKAWQEALDLRSDYRLAAMAHFAAAMLDRTCQLSAEQKAKLGPLLSAALQKRREDPETTWEKADRCPTFLTGQVLYGPLAVQPEPAFKPVLTDSQWARWKANPAVAQPPGPPQPGDGEPVPPPEE